MASKEIFCFSAFSSRKRVWRQRAALACPSRLIPTFEFPISSFDCQRGSIAVAWFQGRNGPVFRGLRVVCRAHQRRKLARGERHDELIERQRQTHSARFDKSFLARPAVEECRRLKLARQRTEYRGFRGRKEPRRDFFRRETGTNHLN